MSEKICLIDLQVIQTNTKTWKFMITRNKVPVDVSGRILFFTVKANPTDLDTAAVIKVTQTCPSNSDSTSGICYLNLSSTDTNVALGSYFYDIKLQQNSGQTIIDRKTIATGAFRVNVSETQRTN